MKTDKFYTVKTLADRLAVTPMTIYRLVEAGKLQAVKIGRAIRFDPEVIEAFLGNVRVGPEGLTEGKNDGKKEKRKS